MLRLGGLNPSGGTKWGGSFKNGKAPQYMGEGVAGPNPVRSAKEALAKREGEMLGQQQCHSAA